VPLVVKQRLAGSPPAIPRAVEPIAVHLLVFFVKNEEKRPIVRHYGYITRGIAPGDRRDAALQP